MVHVTGPLLLREGDRGRLESLVRSSSAPAWPVKRARIVLLAADGLSNTEIAMMVGASRPTVISWRERSLLERPSGHGRRLPYLPVL